MANLAKLPHETDHHRLLQSIGDCQWCLRGLVRPFSAPATDETVEAGLRMGYPATPPLGGTAGNTQIADLIAQWTFPSQFFHVPTLRVATISGHDIEISAKNGGLERARLV
jgi:hypothetical protein